MPLHLRTLDLATLDALEVDSYAIFVAQDERPLAGLGGLLDWRLAAGLSRFLQHGQLSGSSDETFLTPTSGVLPGSRLFAFGLGPRSKMTPELFQQVAARAVESIAKAKVPAVAIGLPEQPPLPVAARALRQALKALESREVYLLGPINELEQALLSGGT